ncbi:Transmembrane protein 19 [Rhizopus stolonifer]|uniref:Transmembrane protein 19 n=1 Tax=Rhizopus stolonifer TaxID=4846 RepID=A0A367K713_RHIST|nr:Transmembrane protein 19 [Rhizopus stolonifer]
MSHLLFALGLSILLVIHSRRKKSLSIDGAAAAFMLGMVTFSSRLWLFTVVLLTFFLSSSRLTKFKADQKRRLEADYEDASERNAVQVACNGLMGGIAVLLFQLNEPGVDCFHQARWSRVLIWAYVGHYACCAGDTWASELGILNKDWPILITRMKKVPPGTNGGVSGLGLAASFAGGTLVGLSAAMTLYIEQACYGFAWELVLVGCLAGVGGSLMDSLLGATVQQSLYSKDQKKIVAQGKQGEDIQIISVCVPY